MRRARERWVASPHRHLSPLPQIHRVTDIVTESAARANGVATNGQGTSPLRCVAVSPTLTHALHAVRRFTSEATPYHQPTCCALGRRDRQQCGQRPGAYGIELGSSWSHPCKPSCGSSSSGRQCLQQRAVRGPFSSHLSRPPPKKKKVSWLEPCHGSPRRNRSSVRWSSA